MSIVVDSFADEIVKTAKASTVLPLIVGLGGIASGATGAYMAYKGGKERRQYMGVTTEAIKTLAGEAQKARGLRITLGKALMMNTKADMISRKALGNAVRQNYSLDRARARAMLRLHGVNVARKTNK